MNKINKININDELKPALIFAMILLIAYLHYTDAPPLSDIHHVIFRLNYIPIILGAFWFRFRGGVITSAIVTFIHLPDLIIFHIPGDLNSYLEVFLYNVIGWLTGYLVSDQTRRKEKERELERQLAKVEHLANLGQMAASVAHEIRNPLQSIKSAAQVLKDSLPQNDNDKNGKKVELMQMMIGEINRLNVMVDDFLVFARPKNPILIEADLNHLVEKTVEIAKFKRGLNPNQIKLNLADNLPDCRFDPEQIRQALINLILNAIEASGENGEVLIVTKSHEKFVVVSVIDNGPGIEESDLKNVFLPFFSKREGGTGLGLSICQKILEAHGGKVEIKNNQSGKGCTASIFLLMVDS
jgi:signal transduction histidine kinase